MFYRSTLYSKLFPTIGFRIITELSSPEDLPDLEMESYLTNGCTIAHISRIATVMSPKLRQGCAFRMITASVVLLLSNGDPPEESRQEENIWENSELVKKPNKTGRGGEI